MRLIFISLFLVTTLFSSIGKVSASRGDVTIQRSSTTISAVRGVLVKTKDVLITQKRSRVQVTLNDNTVIMLGPKSKFSFDAYSQNKDSAEARMKIEHGVFKAITGSIGKIAPHRFKIKTKTSTIGIRGTHFMGIIEDELEKITCIKGKIYVEVKGTVYELAAGKMIIIFKGKVEILELSKFEYHKFIERLFYDIEFKKQDLLPENEEKYREGVVSIDTDIFVNDEISLEKQDPSVLSESLNIISSDISNPDNLLQPFDPDL